MKKEIHAGTVAHLNYKLSKNDTATWTLSMHKTLPETNFSKLSQQRSVADSPVVAVLVGLVVKMVMW